MIEFQDTTPSNKYLAHYIFPGKPGMYWVDFNWYWAEISFRRSEVISQYIFIKGHPDPVGYVSFGQHFKDRFLTKSLSGYFELYHIVIDEKFQRQGLGKAATILALKKLIKSKDVMKLVVACHRDNGAANHLYKTMGFQIYGKNYDNDPLYCATSQMILDMQGLPELFEIKSKSSHGSKSWIEESIQSEKDFNWLDWDKGLLD